MLTMFAVVLVLLVVVCSGNGGQWQVHVDKVKNVRQKSKVLFGVDLSTPVRVVLEWIGQF